MRFKLSHFLAYGCILILSMSFSTENTLDSKIIDFEVGQSVNRQSNKRLDESTHYVNNSYFAWIENQSQSDSIDKKSNEYRSGEVTLPSQYADSFDQNLQESANLGIRDATVIDSQEFENRRLQQSNLPTKPVKSSTSSPFIAPTPSPTNTNEKLKVAVCLTGQLLRLELLSKLKYFFVYNALELGHRMDMFMLLDNNRNEAHQVIKCLFVGL